MSCQEAQIPEPAPETIIKDYDEEKLKLEKESKGHLVEGEIFSGPSSNAAVISEVLQIPEAISQVSVNPKQDQVVIDEYQSDETQSKIEKEVDDESNVGASAEIASPENVVDIGSVTNDAYGDELVAKNDPETSIENNEDESPVVAEQDVIQSIEPEDEKEKAEVYLPTEKGEDKEEENAVSSTKDDHNEAQTITESQPEDETKKQEEVSIQDVGGVDSRDESEYQENKATIEVQIPPEAEEDESASAEYTETTHEKEAVEDVPTSEIKKEDQEIEHKAAEKDETEKASAEYTETSHEKEAVEVVPTSEIKQEDQDIEHKTVKEDETENASAEYTEITPEKEAVEDVQPSEIKDTEDKAAEVDETENASVEYTDTTHEKEAVEVVQPSKIKQEDQEIEDKAAEEDETENASVKYTDTTHEKEAVEVVQPSEIKQEDQEIEDKAAEEDETENASVEYTDTTHEKEAVEVVQPSEIKQEDQEIEDEGQHPLLEEVISRDYIQGGVPIEQHTSTDDKLDSKRDDETAKEEALTDIQIDNNLTGEDEKTENTVEEEKFVEQNEDVEVQDDSSAHHPIDEIPKDKELSGVVEENAETAQIEKDDEESKGIAAIDSQPNNELQKEDKEEAYQEGESAFDSKIQDYEGVDHAQIPSQVEETKPDQDVEEVAVVKTENKLVEVETQLDENVNEAIDEKLKEKEEVQNKDVDFFVEEATAESSIKDDTKEEQETTIEEKSEIKEEDETEKLQIEQEDDGQVDDDKEEVKPKETVDDPLVAEEIEKVADQEDEEEKKLDSSEEQSSNDRNIVSEAVNTEIIDKHEIEQIPEDIPDLHESVILHASEDPEIEKEAVREIIESQPDEEKAIIGEGTSVQEEGEIDSTDVSIAHEHSVSGETAENLEEAGAIETEALNAKLNEEEKLQNKNEDRFVEQATAESFVEEEEIAIAEKKEEEFEKDDDDIKQEEARHEETVDDPEVAEEKIVEAHEDEVEQQLDSSNKQSSKDGNIVLDAENTEIIDKHEIEQIPEDLHELHESVISHTNRELEIEKETVNKVTESQPEEETSKHGEGEGEGADVSIDQASLSKSEETVENLEEARERETESEAISQSDETAIEKETVDIGISNEKIKKEEEEKEEDEVKQDKDLQLPSSVEEGNAESFLEDGIKQEQETNTEDKYETTNTIEQPSSLESEFVEENIPAEGEGKITEEVTATSYNEQVQGLHHASVQAESEDTLEKEDEVAHEVLHSHVDKGVKTSCIEDGVKQEQDAVTEAKKSDEEENVRREWQKHKHYLFYLYKHLNKNRDTNHHVPDINADKKDVAAGEDETDHVPASTEADENTIKESHAEESEDSGDVKIEEVTTGLDSKEGLALAQEPSQLEHEGSAEKGEKVEDEKHYDISDLEEAVTTESSQHDTLIEENKAEGSYKVIEEASEKEKIHGDLTEAKDYVAEPLTETSTEAEPLDAIETIGENLEKAIETVTPELENEEDRASDEANEESIQKVEKETETEKDGGEIIVTDSIPEAITKKEEEATGEEKLEATVETNEVEKVSEIPESSHEQITEQPREVSGAAEHIDGSKYEEEAKSTETVTPAFEDVYSPDNAVTETEEDSAQKIEKENEAEKDSKYEEEAKSTETVTPAFEDAYSPDNAVTETEEDSAQKIEKENEVEKDSGEVIVTDSIPEAITKKEEEATGEEKLEATVETNEVEKVSEIAESSHEHIIEQPREVSGAAEHIDESKYEEEAKSTETVTPAFEDAYSPDNAVSKTEEDSAQKIEKENEAEKDSGEVIVTDSIPEAITKKGEEVTGEEKLEATVETNEVEKVSIISETAPEQIIEQPREISEANEHTDESKYEEEEKRTETVSPAFEDAYHLDDAVIETEEDSAQKVEKEGEKEKEIEEVLAKDNNSEDEISQEEEKYTEEQHEAITEENEIEKVSESPETVDQQVITQLIEKLEEAEPIDERTYQREEEENVDTVTPVRGSEQIQVSDHTIANIENEDTEEKGLEEVHQDISVQQTIENTLETEPIDTIDQKAHFESIETVKSVAESQDVGQKDIKQLTEISRSTEPIDESIGQQEKEESIEKATHELENEEAPGFAQAHTETESVVSTQKIEDKDEDTKSGHPENKVNEEIESDQFLDAKVDANESEQKSEGAGQINQLVATVEDVDDAPSSDHLYTKTESDSEEEVKEVVEQTAEELLGHPKENLERIETTVKSIIQEEIEGNTEKVITAVNSKEAHISDHAYSKTESEGKSSSTAIAEVKTTEAGANPIKESSFEDTAVEELGKDALEEQLSHPLIPEQNEDHKATEYTEKKEIKGAQKDDPKQTSEVATETLESEPREVVSDPTITTSSRDIQDSVLAASLQEEYVILEAADHTKTESPHEKEEEKLEETEEAQSKKSSSNLFQASVRRTNQEDPVTEKSDTKDAEEAEAEEEEEQGHVEDSGDADSKAQNKKHSHNLLYGVGSKVKHSLGKVKKAITGKSKPK